MYYLNGSSSSSAVAVGFGNLGAVPRSWVPSPKLGEKNHEVDPLHHQHRQRSRRRHWRLIRRVRAAMPEEVLPQANEPCLGQIESTGLFFLEKVWLLFRFRAVFPDPFQY